MNEDSGMPVYERPREGINLGQMITTSYDLRSIAEAAKESDSARVTYARLMTPETGIVLGHIIELIASEADVTLHHEHCHVNNCLSCAGQVLTDKLYAAMKSDGSEGVG